MELLRDYLDFIVDRINRNPYSTHDNVCRGRGGCIIESVKIKNYDKVFEYFVGVSELAFPPPVNPPPVNPPPVNPPSINPPPVNPPNNYGVDYSYTEYGEEYEAYGNNGIYEETYNYEDAYEGK